MDLYLAVDSISGEVKVFLYRDELERFATAHEYDYEYLVIEGSAYPISLSELKNS